MLRTVEVKCDDEGSSDLERSDNMLASPDAKKKSEASPSPTTKLTKQETPPKASGEDPKPRIVLTFRSEKTGTRSNNMKIVSAEEKQEEVSPRRSGRMRSVPIFGYKDGMEFFLPKKEKNLSENDEASDSSNPKRSTRRQSKEYSDNVLANTVAWKEKYNEPGPTQRPSRRIKPTPKVLGNKELRWLQSQKVYVNPEEGMVTRRQSRRKSSEVVEPEKRLEEEKVFDEDEDMEEEEKELEDSEEQSEVQSNNVKKLKHLCELGLRAITPTSQDDEASQEDDDRDVEMEAETDEDEELISKLAEGSSDEEDEELDEDFSCSATVSRGGPRRSSRRPRPFRDGSTSEEEISANPAAADDGSEATCPEDESGVIGQCYCDTASNVYALPKDLVEPVFCQAIELVDGVRVGCSHGAAKTDGAYAPLVRSGPRAPFILACESHRRQLRKHMCCAACGLFCSQGTFYRCSQNHLFHLDCGISSSKPHAPPGCPHCGVYSYRWQPVNTDCCKVAVQMKCTNKRVFLPDQRVQCTQAYLGFSTLDPSILEQEPIIPRDLLPSLSVDLETLKSRAAGEVTDAKAVYDAICAGASADELLPLIVSCPDINKPVTPSGGTVLHAAARRGRLCALYLAQYAGANLDAVDDTASTALMCAVRALSKKTPPKVKSSESDVEMDAEPESEKEDDDGKECEGEGAKEEDLIKVIRYLVAAGCDVNLPGPEGMTALHTAARHGRVAACAAILDSARAAVDARDHGGWTPLVWAAEHEQPAVVRLLLEHGADATATDIEGNAAAHWCALAGDAHSLRLLVESSPRAVAVVNAHRDTPLHVAARQGHYACVVILLAQGARTDVENSAGELPVQVCSGECQSAIALNMQMASVASEHGSRYRMLSSDISNGREQHAVPCINEVDDAPLPDDFTYVTRHVTPRAVAVDDTIDTLQGCTCTDGTCSSDTCGCIVLGVKRWFHAGRLLPTFPYHEPPMLFQCNHTCACNAKLCTNSAVTRATQNGSLMTRACVFRAGGARGWGLRTTAAIQRGAPVATYCGELLTVADADTRARDQYMFALDLKPDLREQCEYKTLLCVDAAQYGSAARFINHSCAPNLAPVRVFTSTRDLRLPTVCLFATRAISAGEELTFDYGDKFWSVKSKWMKCECGATECRYPVQTPDDTE